MKYWPVALLTCLVGCVPAGRLTCTSFLKSHNPRVALKSSAAVHGCEIVGEGGSESYNRKEFEIRIVGDSSKRDKLMLDYRDSLRSDLGKAGLRIVREETQGDSARGLLNGFCFGYEGEDVQGIARVKSGFDLNGKIIIDVLLLEYN